MSGTKRILLNVEVTPDLSHRPEVRPAMRRRTGVQQRSGRSTRSEDDILTEESESVCPERSGKRSLFSQLGQWLCQASPDSLAANGITPRVEPPVTGVVSDCRSPPVISLPAPGDVQYRLQYTPLTDRGVISDNVAEINSTSDLRPASPVPTPCVSLSIICFHCSEKSGGSRSLSRRADGGQTREALDTSRDTPHTNHVRGL